MILEYIKKKHVSEYLAYGKLTSEIQTRHHCVTPAPYVFLSDGDVILNLCAKRLHL